MMPQGQQVALITAAEWEGVCQRGSRRGAEHGRNRTSGPAPKGYSTGQETRSLSPSVPRVLGLYFQNSLLTKKDGNMSLVWVSKGFSVLCMLLVTIKL